MLYGTITEFCTEERCAIMSAGPKYEYHWADGQTVKKPIKCSAPKYIDYLMTWVQDQLDDETLFPIKIGPLPCHHNTQLIYVAIPALSKNFGKKLAFSSYRLLNLLRDHLHGIHLLDPSRSALPQKLYPNCQDNTETTLSGLRTHLPPTLQVRECRPIRC